MENYNSKVHRDFLKLFAIFWVTYNHTSEFGWFAFAKMPNGSAHTLNLILHAFTPIGVALFFMVSGANLLCKKESLIDLYRKRVKRWLLIILVSSFLLYIYSISIAGEQFSIVDYLKSLYGSSQHCPTYLWDYLLFLMAIPFLVKVCEDIKLCKYLIIIWYLFFEVLPFLEIAIFHAGVFSPRNDIPNGLFFWLFPIAGYALEKIEISPKQIIEISFLSVLSLFFQVFRAHHYYLTYGTAGGAYYSICISGCIFVVSKLLFRELNLGRRCVKIVHKLSTTTLWIFLLQGVLQWKTLKVYILLAPLITGQVASFIWALSTILLCQIIAFGVKGCFFIIKKQFIIQSERVSN